MHRATSFRVRRAVARPRSPVLVPADLAALYHLRRFYDAGIYGTTERIAFVEFAPPKASDDDAFWQAYSLRPGLNRPVRTVLPPETPTLPQALGETDLDLEYAGALAPGAELTAYVVDGSLPLHAFLPELWTVLRRIAEAGIHIVSISLGAGELDCADAAPFVDRTTGRIWADLATFTAAFDAWLAASGLLVFVAAGDTGAYAGFPDDPRVQASWPAVQAGVVAVGGTQLAIPGDLASGEQAWGGQDLDPFLPGFNAANTLPSASGGGGMSLSVGTPAYQAGFGAPARLVPDIAAFAGPLGIVDEGQWVPVWGTSAAAPIAAAIAALYHEATGTWLTQDILYATARDVVTGNNSNDALLTAGLLAFESAAPGFDLCTGAGVPDADGLPGLP